VRGTEASDNAAPGPWTISVIVFATEDLGQNCRRIEQQYFLYAGDAAIVRNLCIAIEICRTGRQDLDRQNWIADQLFGGLQPITGYGDIGNV
jgi:hypothetical protein